MGYTHYWTLNRKGAQRDWSRAMVEAAKIIHDSPVPLGNGNGKGKPVINEQEIQFNGRSDRKCTGAVNHCTGGDCGDNQAHESFELPMDLHHFDAQRYWGFCKTAQKPYDTIIVAVLAHYAPRCITVSSDGCPGDWVAGVRLARKLLDDSSIGIPAGVLSGAGWSADHQHEHELEGSIAIDALNDTNL